MTGAGCVGLIGLEDVTPDAGSPDGGPGPGNDDDAAAPHDSGSGDEEEPSEDSDGDGTTGDGGDGESASEDGSTDLDAGTPPPPPSAPPPIEAFFNTPAGNTADATLEDKVIELVGLALPGSSVHVSIFNLTRAPPAHAFADAAARGVDVHLVLDGQNADNAVFTILEAGLPPGNITLCGSAVGTSCIGTGINHSKFYLFSALADGSTHVVVQSSANLTNPMLNEFNDLVVVRDDPALYDGYLQYWSDQRAQLRDDDYYRTIDGDRAVRAYFYPRASGDTILSVLDNAVCGAGGRIDLGMSLFTNGRLEVAERLADKARSGCVVRAVLRDDDDVPGTDIVPALLAGGVEVTLLQQTTTRSTMHSKTLLIDTLYRTTSGTSARKLVFTGSHNYTLGALRENDEQLMRIDDEGVFSSFRANFEHVRAQAP